MFKFQTKIIKKLNLKVKNIEKNLTYFEVKIFEKKKCKNRQLYGLALTRMVKKQFFLTIKGKNHDGAQFIPDALKREAKYILSSKNYKDLKKNY